ncbi:alkaline phosphatase, tissue-nonspecific isozyme-like [Pectinophora gossypiella]|uniref:alkaline phosphatase, tissue-nonspecific isozyme-like n=1 Tax=Pectinophora gossypiella TaxID=13191 RepID=UPI00214F3631|nr:alkaline phosphatase, tissue-nonspecific isozyme-like [Pectinophora gossypiella]
MEFSKRFFVTILFVSYSVFARSIHQNNDQQSTAHFDEKNEDHWRLQAQWTLRTKVFAPLNTKVAKNIILFLGDGMSITTLAATRVYLGHKYKHFGEELKLSFEAFPYTGLAKTYCVDQNVADSACSGTAYLTGVKANSGTVGLSGAVKRGDCESQKDGEHSLTGLVDWAQRAGKRTGVVTTTRVTHATPAASFAHSADRRWESDSDLPNGFQCPDIAKQLVRGKVGSRIDIVFGGGRKNFFPKSEKDAEGHYGYRSDKTDLIREWLIKKINLGVPAKYVYNRKQLMKLNKKENHSVLGLFSPDHMPYHLEAEEDDPTLSEMTVKAIELLDNKNGFFLFVEGGRIDTAHHEAKARKALDETAEFAKAVEAALRMVNPEDTLVVVTSDHSHTMTYSGYSKRGTDILSFTNKLNATDNIPYTTLSYANGPGYRPHDNFIRPSPTLEDLQNINFTYPALVPILRETHGGEDVAVFAKGPWSHLFSGNFEQNFIPHAIAYASCIGPGLTHCSV